MTCEQDSTIPPIEWYAGFAWEGEGIRRVRIGTDKFYNLHHDLRLHMGNWGHTQLSYSEKEYKSPGEAKFHEEEGIIVEQLTGFHPEVLIQRARDLEKEYQGRAMGPFLLGVYWTK